ncbi:unnamed protein product [Paramecium octaurelia]|uniref:Uncharacterized protein n=1 Tax=Paramecium octaurelia TaxID=43137 RepID=A0A8S1X5I3_PAROT|nr:unnamed protein product [Paramecium octaurelia]
MFLCIQDQVPQLTNRCSIDVADIEQQEQQSLITEYKQKYQLNQSMNIILKEKIVYIYNKSEFDLLGIQNSFTYYLLIYNITTKLIPKIDLQNIEIENQPDCQANVCGKHCGLLLIYIAPLRSCLSRSVWKQTCNLQFSLKVCLQSGYCSAIFEVIKKSIFHCYLSKNDSLCNWILSDSLPPKIVADR